MKWSEAKYTDPTICVRFVDGVKTLNFKDQQARQKEFEQKMMDHTIKVHNESFATEDPVKTQSWSPSFIPPELPLAALPQQP